MANEQETYRQLSESLAARGLNSESIKASLKTQHIETPSWGYGDSGTRFKVFAAPGAARNIYEKISDAAEIHRLTGIAPSVALHIPWDKVDDWQGLKEFASAQGITLGAINPNLFQDDVYKFGSLCHPDPAVRRIAGEHMLECVEIMRRTGSRDLSLWLADGTNYAGQDNLRGRKARMEEALQPVYKALPENARLLIEYKFFEPSFYHTDLADWGMSANTARKLGAKAKVLVDTGHHASGTNIEHIVAFLLDEDLLGGFHFNNRKYADDDLIVGTVNPFELFLIFNELVAAAEDKGTLAAVCAGQVAYMIDQSHNIEPKLEAMLQSVLNCQTAYAKALLVDRPSLANAQTAQDVLGAHRTLMDAYETDVRPLLVQVRRESNIPVNPIAALKSSPYLARIVAERGSGRSSSGGYPGA
jgi:L-rhamnose isomerase / sugar isomerase